MRLVVDASTLVAEALRARGRELIRHPNLELLIAAEAWQEARHELRKRAAVLGERGYLDACAATQLSAEVFSTIEARVTVVAPDVYASRVEEARRRIPRDPRDAPTVALALAQEIGIWTADRDFFGCGVPVWTTDVLLAELGGGE